MPLITESMTIQEILECLNPDVQNLDATTSWKDILDALTVRRPLSKTARQETSVLKQWLEQDDDVEGTEWVCDALRHLVSSGRGNPDRQREIFLGIMTHRFQRKEDKTPTCLLRLFAQQGGGRWKSSLVQLNVSLLSCGAVIKAHPVAFLTAELTAADNSTTTLFSLLLEGKLSTQKEKQYVSSLLLAALNSADTDAVRRLFNLVLPCGLLLLEAASIQDDTTPLACLGDELVSSLQNKAHAFFDQEYSRIQKKSHRIKWAKWGVGIIILIAAIGTVVGFVVHASSLIALSICAFALGSVALGILFCVHRTQKEDLAGMDRLSTTYAVPRQPLEDGQSFNASSLQPQKNSQQSSSQQNSDIERQNSNIEGEMKMETISIQPNE